MAELRVLHIDTGESFRGGQRQVQLLIERLEKMGVKQALAVSPRSPLPKSTDKIPVFKLSKPYWRYLALSGKLVRWTNEHNITLVHAHDSHGHTIGLALKRKLKHLSLVVSRRVTYTPSGWLSARFKYTDAVDQFVAISEATARSLYETGIAAEKVRIIRSGIDLARIAATPAGHDSVSSFCERYTKVVIWAGSLTSEKDPVTAVKAFAQAAKRVPDAGLIMAGEGSLKAKLLQLTEALDCGNILFAGQIEPLAAALKVAHVFLATSVSEGLNTSVLEAMACGLPLVVSETGGLVELAESNKNGLLCPAGDIRAFSDALVELLLDDDRRKQMGGQSMEKAADFDISVTAQKTLALYTMLCSEGPERV